VKGKCLVVIYMLNPLKAYFHYSLFTIHHSPFTNMQFTLEVIGFTIDGCVAAQQAGAHRIELCDNPGEGGTTPSYGFIKAAREKLHIALYPIIRPRGGDFLYSDEEFEIMKNDVGICKELGCDGVVIGMLKKEGTIDKERCSQLVRIAYPMGVTFHRAFDRVSDPVQALEDVIDIGCERILTSGLAPGAMEGAQSIANLVKQADGRISIMPGSGLRSDNILLIARVTGATEFHTSARTWVESKMDFSSKTMKEQLQSVALDTEEVQKILASLKTFE
jgi:copper homeostasis protein